jgi:hypothetical protein
VRFLEEYPGTQMLREFIEARRREFEQGFAQALSASSASSAG